MVPRAGIEPARCCHRGILSPLRLPISPPGQMTFLLLTNPFASDSCRFATTVYHNATWADDIFITYYTLSRLLDVVLQRPSTTTPPGQMTFILLTRLVLICGLSFCNDRLPQRHLGILRMVLVERCVFYVM